MSGFLPTFMHGFLPLRSPKGKRMWEMSFSGNCGRRGMPCVLKGFNQVLILWGEDKIYSGLLGVDQPSLLWHFDGPNYIELERGCLLMIDLLFSYYRWVASGLSYSLVSRISLLYFFYFLWSVWSLSYSPFVPSFSNEFSDWNKKM